MIPNPNPRPEGAEHQLWWVDRGCPVCACGAYFWVESALERHIVNPTRLHKL